jgi:hypothetical protein
MPISEKTIALKSVDSLKWDGTPRHFCMLTRSTSPTEATVRTPMTPHPVARRTRSTPAIHASVSTLMPNESPNTIGLRHDTGPSQDPPSMRKTTAWNALLNISKAPHQ